MLKIALKSLIAPALKWRWLNYNFGDFKRKINKKRVNVYYWKPKTSDNVGDLLSYIIVRHLLNLKGIEHNVKTCKTVRLFAVGSIIDSAYGDVTVWGSGLRSHQSKIREVKLDVRAVRGPLTRERLINQGFSCPEVYGDPAILLPWIYFPKITKTKDFIIIPHYSKESYYLKKHPTNTLSTLTSDWKSFISTILSSKLVISGSLHGIIIAESYGIPAILLSDSLDEGKFKYDDYYRSTGRNDYSSANDVESALKLPAPQTPNLEKLKNDLIRSFPYDIWGG